MSDTPEVIFDAPTHAKKKPAKKRKTRKAAPTPKATASQFEGMTKIACADGCNAEACVVSGKPYCAHPTKGGLQAADQNNPAALKRLQAARVHLGVKVDPKRFTDD